MGGEGHMLDMIRRLSEGRETSRLRRERANDKLKHLNRTNEPYPLPNTTPEEMDVSSTTRRKRKKRTAIISFGGRLLSWESSLQLLSYSGLFSLIR